MGFNGQGSSSNLYHRWSGWSYFYFPCRKIGADSNSDGTDRGGSIFLYVTGSDHSAANHETSYNRRKNVKSRWSSFVRYPNWRRFCSQSSLPLLYVLILPTTAPLVGMLMLGNLFRESGVVRQLTETASNALMYIVVILLGTSVGATTSAEAFLKCEHTENRCSWSDCICVWYCSGCIVR